MFRTLRERVSAMAGGEWRLIIFQGFWPRHSGSGENKSE